MAVLVYSTAISQSKSGIVLSSHDNRPVAFVNIYSKKTSSGTVTNENGAFKLLSENGEDSIILSHIGYKRRSIESKKFFQATSDTIYLELEVIELENLVVFGGDSRSLVKKAVKNISKNFPSDRIVIQGHFRNLIEENRQPVIFLEAGLSIFKASYYGKKKASKVSVLNVQASSNRSKIFSQFVASPKNVINAIDFTKNKPFLHKDIENYTFDFSQIIPFQNSEIYVIRFKPKQEFKTKYTFSGTIYLEKLTLSFVKLEYSITFSEKYSISKNVGLETEFNQTFEADNYQIFFKPLGDQWVISYIRTETTSNVLFTHSRSEIQVKLIQELLASKSSPLATQIDESNLINTSESIYKYSTRFDEKMWSSFNQIVPDESLKAFMSR